MFTVSGFCLVREATLPSEVDDRKPQRARTPLQTQIASKISVQIISSLEAETPGPSSEE